VTIEQKFLACARAIGVEGRVAALLVDCDRALADQPEAGDPPWIRRLEGQRRQLAQPDLRTIAAITTQLVEETPSLAPLLVATMHELVVTHPDLRPFHQRLARAAAIAGAPGIRPH
jgi:hypothetical protein